MSKLTRDLRALEQMVSPDIYAALMRGVEVFTSDVFYDPETNNNAINALAALVFENNFAENTLIRLDVLRKEVSADEKLHYLRSMDEISKEALHLYVKVLREKFQECDPDTIIPKIPASSSVHAPFEMIKNAFKKLHPERDEVSAAAFIFYKLKWIIRQITADSLSSAYLNLVSEDKGSIIRGMLSLRLNACNPSDNFSLGTHVAHMLKVLCESSKIDLKTTQQPLSQSEPEVDSKVETNHEATDLFIEIAPEAEAVITFFTEYMAKRFNASVEVTVKPLMAD